MHYRLLLMAALHFVAMYILMYAMVNRLENVLPNVNQIYMAGLMTAPMLIIEILLMGAMYENKRALYAILCSSIVMFVACFFFIREQTGVFDRQFLKSMIPHHAGAILMCEQAPIQNTEIRELCQTIIASQQAEIDQMKRILIEID